MLCNVKIGFFEQSKIMLLTIAKEHTNGLFRPFANDDKCFYCMLFLFPTIPLSLVFLGVYTKFYKTLRASYLVYSILFYVIVFGSRNMRYNLKYFALLFPLFFILANISKNLIVNIAMGVLLFIGFVVYFYMFLNGFPIH